MDLKRKLQVAEALKKNPFEHHRIPEFLSCTHVPELRRAILTTVLKNLVLLDTEVSASYDLLTEQEWHSLFQAYSTPLPESYAQLKEKVESLSSSFTRLRDELSKPLYSIEEILQSFSSIFKNKTRNMQFLLFLVAKQYPRHVFGFLMAQIRKDPRLYAPFFASLFVRLRLPDSEESLGLKSRCINAYVAFLRTKKLSRTTDSVVLYQFLLYIFCFDSSYYEAVPGIQADIESMFRHDLPGAMNKDVVDRFCDMYGHKYPMVEHDISEWLLSFPFDVPICPAIMSAIEPDYRTFGDAAE